jgi:hypothetical protein
VESKRRAGKRAQRYAHVSVGANCKSVVGTLGTYPRYVRYFESRKIDRAK